MPTAPGLMASVPDRPATTDRLGPPIRVVVMGVSGARKTTVAERLARDLDTACTNTDDLQPGGQRGADARGHPADRRRPASMAPHRRPSPRSRPRPRAGSGMLDPAPRLPPHHPGPGPGRPLRAAGGWPRRAPGPTGVPSPDTSWANGGPLVCSSGVTPGDRPAPNRQSEGSPRRR